MELIVSANNSTYGIGVRCCVFDFHVLQICTDAGGWEIKNYWLKWAALW